LFAVGTRRALGIGVALQAFQQLIGINTVMYYAATILEKAGIGITTGEYLFEGKVAAVRYSVLVGLVAMIMSIIALFLIDRIGMVALETRRA
jgi:SP family myo-inositol transporter-like MFS transporter 13